MLRTTAALSFPGRTLRDGVSNPEAVLAVQRRLNALGSGRVPEDGGFTSATTRVVKRFQVRFSDVHGVPLNDRVDQQGLPGVRKMTNCLFCKIIAGDIPGTLVHQDDSVVALKDINPQAPLHLLIVPRRHIATLNDLGPGDDALVGSMVRRAAEMAREHGFDERGYRTVFNCNREAGQTVFHIHLHLLAGRGMAWPPG